MSKNISKGIIPASDETTVRIIGKFTQKNFLDMDKDDIVMDSVLGLFWKVILNDGENVVMKQTALNDSGNGVTITLSDGQFNNTFVMLEEVSA